MATYNESRSGISVVPNTSSAPSIALASTTNPYTQAYTPFVDDNVSLPLDLTVYEPGHIQPGRTNELNLVVTWEGSLEDGFSIGCHIGAGTNFTEEGATKIFADAIRNITRDEESGKTLKRSCYLASLEFVIPDHKVRTHPQSDIAASAVATTLKALYNGSNPPKTKTHPYFRGHGGTIVAATPEPSIAASLGKTTGKGNRRSYVTVAKNKGSFRLAKQDSEMKGHMNQVASSPNYALYSLPCSLEWQCGVVRTMIRQGDPDAEAKNERSLAGRNTFTNYLGLGPDEVERPILPTPSKKSKRDSLATPKIRRMRSSSTTSSRPPSKASSGHRSQSRSPSTPAHSRRVAISASQVCQMGPQANQGLATYLEVPNHGNDSGALSLSASHSPANRIPNAEGLSASFSSTKSPRTLTPQHRADLGTLGRDPHPQLYHPGERSQPDDGATTSQYVPHFQDRGISVYGDDAGVIFTVEKDMTCGPPQPSNSVESHAPERDSGVEEAYPQQPRYAGTQGTQAPYFVTNNQHLDSTSYGSHCSPHEQQLQGFQRLANQTHHNQASAAPSQSTVNKQPPASSDPNAQMTSKQGYYDPTSHDPEEGFTDKRYYSGWQY
jgi:hypothetical protein